MDEKYFAQKIERKWQKQWAASGAFEVEADDAKPKFYCLEMLPYPSGRLHMGHVRNYSIGDALAWYKRLQGFNVLHPIGWDSFGQPAEQAAIKKGVNPRDWTEDNIKQMRDQLQRLGVSYDWRREIAAHRPEYYKFDQWFFLKMLEKGLAYKRMTKVNWCPKDQTTLSNEQASGGVCWRCGTAVEKKDLAQWFLRITAYADELLQGLSSLETGWSERVLTMQRNWIGRSDGAFVEFKVQSAECKVEDSEANPKVEVSNLKAETSEFESVRVFTTRIDTIYGANAVVLAAEHPIIEANFTELSDEVRAKVEQIKIEKAKPTEYGEEVEKDGVDTGLKAINPFSGEELPVWVGNYVMMEYGTGAVMSVPAHDERDFEFAKRFALPVVRVVASETEFAAQETLSDDGQTRKDDERAKKDIERTLSDDGKLKKDDEQSLSDDGQTLSDNSQIASDNGQTLPDDGRTLPDGSQILSDDGQTLSDDVQTLFDDGQTLSDDVQILSDDERTLSDGGQIELDETRIEEDGAAIGFASNAVRFAANAVESATQQALSDYGIAVNSGAWSGKASADAKREMTEFAAAHGFGEAATTFRLRDWGISRQRFWGAPIPVVYCEKCGTVPVPVEQLPVKLPESAPFTGVGESPLAKVPEFVNTTCPNCNEPAKRETDTMDTFVDSTWYYFRYADPHNREMPFDPEIIKYWLPVDQYIGGVDHAVMHLLYTRFWTKVMRDIGLVEFAEPVKNLLTQGMVVGESYYSDDKASYIPQDEVKIERDERGKVLSAKLKIDGSTIRVAVEKMSKSKYNGVDPDDMIAIYGADAVRLFALFAAPAENELVWQETGIDGAVRFLQRVYRFVYRWHSFIAESNIVEHNADSSSSDAKKLRQKTHRTIRRITGNLESYQFNTPVAALMELSNALGDFKVEPEKAGGAELFAVREALDSLILMLAPYAPHVAEELWAVLTGSEQGILQSGARFPVADEDLVKADEIEIPIQVNGKLRSRVLVAPETAAEQLEAMALSDVKIKEYTDGKQIVKVVVVPNRLVNIVVK